MMLIPGSRVNQEITGKLCEQIGQELIRPQG